MKKFTGIAGIAMAIALGFMFSANAQAITPTQFKTKSVMADTEISFEEKIEVQDWMLSFEVFPNDSKQEVEEEIRLEAWMISESWSFNANQVVSESDIELEDWMTQSFREDEKGVMALGL